MWLKSPIDFNTVKRTVAKNSFEKDFFKLMNNPVFGKTLENLRNRVDVQLVTNEKKLSVLTSKPTFVSMKFFITNLVAVHKVKETLTLNKPASLMYDFHNNFIKSNYRKKLNYFSRTQIHSTTRSRQRMCTKISGRINKNLIFIDYSKESEFHDDTNK